MPDYRLARRPGRPQWYVVWSEGGRSRRVSTGTENAAEAKIFLAAFTLEAEGGPQLDPRDVAVVAVLASYRDNHAASLPSAMQARIAVDHLTRHFGERSVADLSPNAVAGYIAERRTLVSGETVSRELSVLRAAMNRAVRNGSLASAPHIADVPRAEPRERVLTRKEAAALLNACRGKRLRHLALFVRLGLYTGARPGAILDLTWDRVDFGLGLIDFVLPSRRQTAKRRAVVPFDRSLARALRYAHATARTGWVIEWGEDRAASVKKAFGSAARRAGLKDVTPGTLRHTSASWARAGGADLFQIGALLGHSRLGTTQRYAKYGPDYLREVVGAIRSKTKMWAK